MPPHKDSEVCVLKAFVKKDTSLAGFDLALEQLGQDQEMSLECLHAYARPWDGKSQDSKGSRKWKLKLTLHFRDSAWETFHLATPAAGSVLEPKTVADIVESLLQQEETGRYQGFLEKPCIKYQEDHYVLRMPGGFFVKFNSQKLAALLGFYPIESEVLETAVGEDGSVKLSSSIPDHHAFVLMGNKVNQHEQSQKVLQEDGTLSVTIGPSQADQTVEYEEDSTEVEVTLDKVKDWINKALSTCLAQLALDPSLLVCSVEDSALKVLANQSFGSSPFTVKLKLGNQLSADIHDDSGETNFRFGLPTFAERSLGYREAQTIGQWVPTADKSAIAWSDPLTKIAPFYLVSDALEGGSYLSRTGNVSVVVYVGNSLPVQLSNPIKTRGRVGRITLRFLDSEMKECVFPRPFKFFLVFRMT